MSGLRFCLFLAALCSCSLLGRGDLVVPKTELKDVLSLGKGVVTDEVPEAVVTPTEPTPSPEPDTTTKSSTTTTTTTTTTPAPSPTPTPTPPPKPTPAPKPTPVPAPERGTWTYTSASNVTCIVVQFAAQISLTYTKSVLNKTSLANVTMNVPANASVLGGSCNSSETEQWMVIGWLTDSGAPVSVRLQFFKNETTKNYGLHCFNLTVDGSILVNASTPADSVVLSHGEEWTTALATSYRCAAPEPLSMSNETYAITASVALSRLQEEAFRSGHGAGFSVARDCYGGDLPDAVPIAVGCALGGLVLVVLVAYLLARRRSAARGYLSM